MLYARQIARGMNIVAIVDLCLDTDGRVLTIHKTTGLGTQKEDTGRCQLGVLTWRLP